MITAGTRATVPGAPDLAIDIRRWLAEDVGDGDRTTNAIVPPDARSTARLLMREEGVRWRPGNARQVFQALDPKGALGARWWLDGDRVAPGPVGTAEASPSRAHAGERLALNLLGRLSGMPP